MTDNLTDRDVRLLNRLSQTAGQELLKPIIRQGQVCFQARQFVGIVRLGNRTLQILPKIYQSEERDVSIAEASRNLLWMLDYAGHLSIKENDLAAMQQAQDWFEILIYFFATHLKRQWLRGAPRNYQAVDAVLPVLKGKWRIPAQMRRPEQKHRFAVTYDEFTTDNPLNRIFRYVVELLWKLTRDGNNRQLLSDLRYWMDEVTLLPAIALQDAQTVKLTRLNQQYEPLLNLAMLFLQNLGLELSAHDQTAFAFLFDMNQLFEGFLTGFLQRHRREILPAALSDCQLLPQGRQAVCHLAQVQNRRVFRLKPDLVLRDRDYYPRLLDFKYKRLNPSDRKLGISEADFYQMYAYLNRFQAPQVTLVYPQTAGMAAPIRSCFSLEGSSGEIRAVTVNLLRDLTAKGAHKELIAELRQILEQTDGGRRRLR
ncbi:McrC family protein [Halomicronema sp. CCY15110]|uniref:McrC family protein n=1 Tax=Halomicronema sp. CCY15110 TaxID=2767773 RepID=UPI00194FB283|nr:hypothetical protein [Halomicronema sp. CCY15110]